MPSDNLPPAKSAARRAFFAPAHPATTNGNNEPITELKITPETLGFTTKNQSSNKPLSRRDRRRLRRLAASK